MSKNTKASLAYPRAFVHPNRTGAWCLAWRHHPITGNHWDATMLAPHYPTGSLSQACDAARAIVDHVWFTLGTGGDS